jgi:4-O-beta-D-mannosyl-D-glucose phosphorylase
MSSRIRSGSSVSKLVDTCLNTPEDPLRSAACVQQRMDLIRSNRALLADQPELRGILK